MAQVTIAPDGTITLPKAMLDHMGLPSGGRIAVTKLPDGELEFKAITSRADGHTPATRPRGDGSR